MNSTVIIIIHVVIHCQFVKITLMHIICTYTVATIVIETSSTSRCSPVPNSFSSSNWITLVSSKAFQVILQFHFQIYPCTNGVHLEVELENHLKFFGRNQCYPVGTGKGIWWYWATSGSGTGKVFQLLWSLLQYC